MEQDLITLTQILPLLTAYTTMFGKLISQADRLYAAALAKIELIKQPRCSYIVKVADLSILVGYEDYALSLGDTVWIKDEDLGIEAKSTVVKVTEYPLWPEERGMVIDTVPLKSYQQME